MMRLRVLGRERHILAILEGLRRVGIAVGDFARAPAVERLVHWGGGGMRGLRHDGGRGHVMAGDRSERMRSCCLCRWHGMV